MANNYIATFEQPEQVTPDDWKLIRYCLKVDSNTPIFEIENWIREKMINKESRLMQFEIL